MIVVRGIIKVEKGRKKVRSVKEVGRMEGRKPLWLSAASWQSCPLNRKEAPGSSGIGDVSVCSHACLVCRLLYPKAQLLKPS